MITKLKVASSQINGVTCATFAIRKEKDIAYFVLMGIGFPSRQRVLCQVF